MELLELILVLVREDHGVHVAGRVPARKLDWLLATEQELNPTVLESRRFPQPHATQGLQRDPALEGVLAEDGASPYTIPGDHEFVIANVDLSVVAFVLHAFPILGR